MLKKLVFGLVAFARECWKVGIFWEIFVKFAVFELVTLTICIYFYNFYFPTCSFQLGPGCMPGWDLELFFLDNTCAVSKWWPENHRKLSKNPANFEIEPQLEVGRACFFWPRPSQAKIFSSRASLELLIFCFKPLQAKNFCIRAYFEPKKTSLNLTTPSKLGSH